ncbi:MAG: cell wall hydrolase [Betaproteobacteria bacterium]|nr:cell wall hydrolase [Betaproteobacteria bacterium]
MKLSSTILLLLLVLSLSFPNILLNPTKPINNNYKIKHDITQLNCLAKNIYYEALGEGLLGKIAVAQVTLNRVIHQQEFNKTICGVVYQKDQFSWTSSKHRIIKDYKQWEEAKYIAIGVLQGKLFLENFEALYFHANYIKPPWRNSKQYITTIGKHIFYL